MTISELEPFATLGNACQPATRRQWCAPTDFAEDVLETGDTWAGPRIATDN